MPGYRHRGDHSGVPIPITQVTNFNAFAGFGNTPPLGVPNGVLGSPGFGSITSAGDPRVLQLGLKVIF